jgi:hypothetical protein
MPPEALESALQLVDGLLLGVEHGRFVSIARASPAAQDGTGAHPARIRRASGAHPARIRRASGAHPARIRRAASGAHPVRIRTVAVSTARCRAAA